MIVTIKIGSTKTNNVFPASVVLRFDKNLKHDARAFELINPLCKHMGQGTPFSFYICESKMGFV